MKKNKERQSQFYKIVKNLLGKNYSSFKKIKDKKEKAETLKYVLTSHLKLKKLDLEHKAMNNKEFSFAKEKLLIVDPKIRYFETTLNKKDYDSVLKILGEIEKDV
jgi:hypothetical protein